jgi:thioester reductase-like protein
MPNDTTHTTAVSKVGENVFLTGATGLLGAQIMRRVLETSPGSCLTVLVRPSVPGSRRPPVRASARERIDALLRSLMGEARAQSVRERVEVLEGDIAAPDLGLSGERALGMLRERIDHVIHCAATIRFDLPLEVARRDNTEGTRNVLTLADALPRLTRLDYVGTAYACGKREGVIREAELDVGQRFWNSYEQTKMEAEKLVRAYGERHPAAIYRPSIIVGDSRSGTTTAFQGLYQLLPLYTRRLVVAIPADPRTPVDLVPIDYVLSALFALMGMPRSIGRTFHLASGVGNTCTVDELVNMLSDLTKIERPPYVSLGTYRRFVEPVLRAILWGKKRAALRKGRHYLPYLSSKCVFDKANTDQALEGLGIRVPHPQTYFRKLVSFQARADARTGASRVAPDRAPGAPGDRGVIRP